MADNSYRLLDLPNTSFIVHMYIAHPQLLCLWKTPPPPTAGTSFLCDFHAAPETVRAGTTQDTRQKRLYQQWTDSFSNLLINHALQDPPLCRIEILQVYEHRVQYAQYFKRCKIFNLPTHISYFTFSLQPSHIIGLIGNHEVV